MIRDQLAGTSWYWSTRSRLVVNSSVRRSLVTGHQRHHSPWSPWGEQNDAVVLSSNRSTYPLWCMKIFSTKRHTPPPLPASQWGEDVNEWITMCIVMTVIGVGGAVYIQRGVIIIIYFVKKTALIDNIQHNGNTKEKKRKKSLSTSLVYFASTRQRYAAVLERLTRRVASWVK